MEQAATWYDDQRPGLGAEFLAAVKEAIDQITAHPMRWPECTPPSRQYRLKRFPYALVYRVVREQIVLLAVAHLKRRPGYWRDRNRDQGSQS